MQRKVDGIDHGTSVAGGPRGRIEVARSGVDTLRIEIAFDGAFGRRGWRAEGRRVEPRVEVFGLDQPFSNRTAQGDQGRDVGGAVDPVCGMSVDPAKAAGSADYKGQTYYFCSEGCLKKFQQHPDQYGDSPSQPKQPMAAGAIYTCPMHPEVRRDGPGSCPKCGMALEPETVQSAPVRTEYVCPMHPQIVRSEPGTCPICGMALEPRTVLAEEPANPELVDMTRRFWISLALSAPLLVLAMSDLIPGQPVQNLVGPWAWFCGADGPFSSAAGHR